MGWCVSPRNILEAWDPLMRRHTFPKRACNKRGTEVKRERWQDEGAGRGV